MNANSFKAFGVVVISVDLFGFGTGLVAVLGLGDSSASQLEGVSLMLPAVVTVRSWPYLSWRGKRFF